MKGQALTSLIVIMFIGLAIISSAIVLVDIGSNISANFENSNSALAAAESGIEDALLKLLRNPSFSGETIIFDGNTVVVTVTPGTPLTLTSRGTSGNHQRTIQAKINFNSGVMVVESWKEL